MSSSSQRFLCIFLALLLVLFPDQTKATLPGKRERVFCRKIFVNQSGGGNFTTIQAAIDSVPSYNKNWICIYISQGTYREKVTVPYDKPFIYLKGAGKRKTYVVWGDHDSIATSATFTSQADNTMAKCLTFVNSYNSPYVGSGNPMRTAVAAMIQGDKSAFYRCGFVGLQDTLWDVEGRHYFKLCTIQGAVDFIFGSGQSLYERCTISVVAGALNGAPGYITAQGRSQASETNGFVFKDCNINGNGKTYLGRPWRDYARVIFYNTSMSNIVVPQGWDPWFSNGHEYNLSFDELDCRGPGANTAGRVNWANKMSKMELQQLTSFSFIDSDVFFISFGFTSGELIRRLMDYPMISVDPSSHTSFSTIQAAIDSVPPSNKNWIVVSVKAGVYNEQVKIPPDKTFIYLKGEGMGKTSVVWGAHNYMLSSSTFASMADNIMVSGITFVNSYNYPPKNNGNPVKPAVAAKISGDKSAFHECSFLGYQDTLLDHKGRHYFKRCTIEGAVDFIFGGGQSIYERCNISVNIGILSPGTPGYIAAQARTSPNDGSGFVFKECTVSGNGKTYLGRAWKPYSRAIYYASSLSDLVVPQGWDIWKNGGKENQITFAEDQCQGPGSVKMNRVKWEKNLSQAEWETFTSNSYIDDEGWIHNLPLNILQH